VALSTKLFSWPPRGFRRLSLRAELLLALTGMVLFVGILSGFLEAGYVHRSLPQAQSVLAIDLSAAQEVYREYTSHIGDVVHLMAQQRLLRENLQANNIDNLIAPLQAVRQSEDLDFLVLADLHGRALFPARIKGRQIAASGVSALIASAIQQRKGAASTILLSGEELAALSPEMAERARIPVVATPHSPSAGASSLSDGLVAADATPVLSEDGELVGVLCAGQLLNRRNSVADRIRSNLYRDERFDGRDVAVASIFLGDIRIATSATTASGERAVGTQASADVYERVMLKGERWLKAGYVVDDWYLTAYEPIRDPGGKVIGALGLGILNRKFDDLPRRAMTSLLALTIIAVILGIVISYLLSDSIMRPVNKLIAATQRIAADPSPQRIRLDGAPPEIEALGNAFNEMALAVHERDERLHRQTHEKLMRSDRLAMVGQLAAGVAHEINNPLGSILLFSRLTMQQMPAVGRARENLERIEKETKRCHAIVKNLLDFARERKPLVESVDVNRLLDETLKLFEGQFLFQNVQVVRDYDAKVAAIPGDQSQLQQVFMNIILNAVDAMKGKGRLEITTRVNEADGVVEIGMSDSGSGISPENMDRIFDPFFTTKGVGHGTGLGLSVSYGIVQSHNGDISVASPPGGGATFTISLPMKKGSC
jgi:two-component system NtrC family sensor kinase